MTVLLSSSSLLLSSSSESSLGSSPRWPLRPGVGQRLLLLIGLWLVAGAHAQDRKYPNGANVFLIGNSFFIPNGRNFELIVQSNTNGDTPAHVFRDVFRGGPNGLPGALWRDSFDAVDSVLQTGTVDVLGMTGGVGEGAQVIDYQRWIDRALSFNANTDIWISAPWPRLIDLTEGSTIEEASNQFTELTLFFGNSFFNDVVQVLRAQYAASNPNIRIMYTTHGINTADLFARFTDDPAVFDGIVGLIGTRETSDMYLFRDMSPGHGGDMVEMTSGLFYYSFLYLENDSDVNTVVLPASTDVYNQQLMRDVVQTSLTYNQRYINGEFPAPAPTGPTPAPTPRPNNGPAPTRPTNRPSRFCLPGDSIVLMGPHDDDANSRTTKRLDELKTGDQVLSIAEPSSNKATTEDVVYLPHLFNQIETEFLEFTCQSTTKFASIRENDHDKNEKVNHHTLRVTEWHYVFVLTDNDTSTAILANEVQVGDKLWKTRQLPEGTFVRDPCTVVSIATVLDGSGYYTAFTMSGKLLVNDGFVVSSYAGGDEGYFLMSNLGHALSHTAAGFLRWLYHWGWADSSTVRRLVDAAAALMEA